MPSGSGVSMPVSVSALVSVEAANNFKRDYAPAVGAVISREFARRAAVYVNPVSVNNTAASLGAIVHQHDASQGPEQEHEQNQRSTFYVGLGDLSVARPLDRVSGGRGFAASQRVRAEHAGIWLRVQKRAGAHMFAP